MESLTKIINNLELDKQTCEHMIFKDRENTRNGHKREAIVSHQESFDDFVISSQNEVIFCRKLYSFFCFAPISSLLIGSRSRFSNDWIIGNRLFFWKFNKFIEATPSKVLHVNEEPIRNLEVILSHVFNLEPRVILAPCQRYCHQIMSSGIIKFLSQKSQDSGFNCACLHCLVIASGWLLCVLKIEHTVRYASGRRKERKLPLCTWTNINSWKLFETLFHFEIAFYGP